MATSPQSLAVSRSAGSPQSLSSLILSKIVVAAQESQPTAPHPLRLLAAGKIDAFSPAYLRPPQAPNPPTSQISKVRCGGDLRRRRRSAAVTSASSGDCDIGELWSASFVDCGGDVGKLR
uniref:Uncharacterized protein n=1 Tax=Oryza sativa subsp. indica TaxID=39946 RepID=Q0P188_ORYSI|nr:hypothetical protein TQH17P5.2 [Oryza sativa Indica Group]